MRSTFVVIALTVLLPACSARTAPAVQPPVAPLTSAEQLQQDLHALFTATAVEHAHWGVSVVSLESGNTLYSSNAGRLMLPASNQKLLTTAAAAERLGWDYRFSTRILTTGPIAADGTVEGDLMIVGNGDPTLNPRHEQRWGAFDEWAAALKNRGIRKISGDVIGDDNAFAEPGWGAGWSWDNLSYGYGAPVGALQYHENQIDVIVFPDMADAAAIIGTSPIGSGIVIENSVKTVAAGGETTLDIARIPGVPFLKVMGQIAADSRPRTLTAAMDNPTRLYLNAFLEALRRQGIIVTGNSVDIDDLHRAVDTSHATEVLADYSPTLSEIIDITMKWSRNGYAETLLFALAPSGEPATARRGLDVLGQTLADWGITSQLYLARDGSGLSRTSYLSAEAIIRLLKHLADDPRHRDVFKSTLPVAGASGTLAERMKGTPAEGRVFAKTGSLSNVRALSGYIDTIAGERLAFSILVNNYVVPTADIDAIVDKALVRLVEFQR